jgi:hypothetical protein
MMAVGYVLFGMTEGHSLSALYGCLKFVTVPTKRTITNFMNFDLLFDR